MLLYNKKMDFYANAACMRKTDKEEKRRKSDSEFRLLEFGIKPELHQVYGNHIFERGKKVDPEKTERARLSIGVILDFMWDVGNGIQSELHKPNLGGFRNRRKKFGEVLQRMFDSTLNEFESLSLLHWILEKSISSAYCDPHVDVLNDWIYPYSKTLCFNITLEDENGFTHMFQFVANFRKHALALSMPTTFNYDIRTTIPEIVQNFRRYEEYIRKEYNAAFSSACVDFSFSIDDVPIGHQKMTYRLFINSR